jgi:uncharacterized membrane protein
MITPLQMDPLLTLILLIVFDLIWITKIMKPLFEPMIQDIQGSPLNANGGRALIAYTILFLFAYIFIPKMDNYTDTFLLGFFTYAIYETTNYTIFDKWNPNVVVLDSLWGGVLLCLLRYFCLN